MSTHNICFGGEIKHEAHGPQRSSELTAVS